MRAPPPIPSPMMPPVQSRGAGGILDQLLPLIAQHEQLVERFLSRSNVTSEDLERLRKIRVHLQALSSWLDDQQAKIREALDLARKEE